jgi:2-iminobutanoate/2-iminopropanoate deaminase
MADVVESTAAPAAIGPYSQGVDLGALVFVSGQIPLDPDTGEIVGTTAAEQAVQCCRNVAGVLAPTGLGLREVVKTTVFLADMADFAAVNEVYAQYFDGPVRPARSAVQVGALPRGVLVEIEAIAAR